MLPRACWGPVPPRRRDGSCRDSGCYGSAGCVWGGRGGWELRAPPPSSQLRESVLGRREAGGGPLGPPSPGARGWAVLAHFAARRSGYRRPGPSLGSPSPVPVSGAPGGSPGPAPLLAVGGPGPRCAQRGGEDPEPRRLQTDRSGADDIGLAWCVWWGAGPSDLRGRPGWEGGGRLGPPPCPPLQFWERRSYS